MQLWIAFRSLVRRPAWFAAVVLSLGAGVGVNTAIFSVVNAVLLRPLPLPDQQNIVTIAEFRNGNPTGSNPNRMRDWENQTSVFANFAAFYGEGAVLVGAQPRRIRALRTIGSVTALLGVQPALGRDFTPEERRGEGQRVALLSHDAWSRYLAGDKAAIGQTLRLADGAAVIVGVLPATLSYPENFEIMIPAPADLQNGSRKAAYLGVLARLKPKVAPARVQAELDLVAGRLARQYPESDAGLSARAVPLLEAESAGARTPLLLLQAVAATVLLIACVNIVTLLLVRASERRRESAIRAALGAGPWGLVRVFLSEGAILSFAGAACGAAAAQMLLPFLLSVLPQDVPRLATASIDGSALIFAAAVAIGCALIFGTLPAWQTLRGGLMIGGAGRSTAGPGRLRLRKALVLSQVALSVLLVCGVSVLIRAFWAANAGPAAFRTDAVWTASVDFPWDTDKTRIDSFTDRVLSGLAALPGVTAAGAVDRLPLSGGTQSGAIAIRGRELAGGLETAQVGQRAASNGYFAALSIPLIEGRLPGPVGDPAKSQREVAINDVLARRYFPTGGAVGSQITFDVKPAPGQQVRWATVVGVVAGVRKGVLEREPMPEVFLPTERTYWPMLNFVVKAAGSGALNAAAIRSTVQQGDSGVVVGQVERLQQRVAQAGREPRSLISLVSGFAFTALLLACIGLTGLVSSDVVNRRAEIGIRLALGADPSGIVFWILRAGLRLAGAGIAVGLAAGFFVSGRVTEIFPGADGLDPALAFLVTVILVFAAAAALVIPARQAALVSPIEAIRNDAQ